MFASRHPVIEGAMRRRTKAIVVVAIIAGAIIAAASLRIYFIREDSGGRVLWNANEAYLFIGVSRRGFRVSYLEYPWAILREYLHGVRLPDDDLGSLTVIRVTPSAVERHVVELKDRTPGSGPGLYTPLGDRIYANCPVLGGLCRWSGDHFEQATEEEQRKLDGINHLTEKDFDSVDGWSKKGIAAGPENTFARITTDVGGRFTLSEKSDALDSTGYASVSIYLQRPGQVPQRIWYLDGHPRRISKVEYEQIFERH